MNDSKHTQTQQHSSESPTLWCSIRSQRGSAFGSTLLILMTLMGIPSEAHAYIGLALGAGTAVMVGLLILSVLLALYVLVWFPIRRRIREARERTLNSTGSGATPQSDEDAG